MIHILDSDTVPEFDHLTEAMTETLFDTDPDMDLYTGDLFDTQQNFSE